MPFSTPDFLAKATRLTGSGRLAEATTLIQQALFGASRDDGRTTSRAAKRASAKKMDRSSHAKTAERTALVPPYGVGDAGKGSQPQPQIQGWETLGRTPPQSEASFARHVHVGLNGALEYMLYTSDSVKSSAPLVVMLHGCSQTAEDFARGTRMNQLADEMGFHVVYPEQSSSANMQRCWNWYRPGDQTRDLGEPQLIAGITREVVDAVGADPDRVYIAGLSAGGAAAVIMAETHPDIFAACGVHSGLSFGAADSLPSAFAAMQNGGGSGSAEDGTFVPVITFHGDRDSTVANVNSDQIIAAAARRIAGTLVDTSQTKETVAGRTFTRRIDSDAKGRQLLEQWTLHGAGHAWSGGDASGSFTDSAGPDASREMLRFFLQHQRGSTPVTA